MNDADNKPKFIKFNDGRHGQELEVLAGELASEMPKEVRGKLAPSLLWIARHFKTQNDDLRVNREKVSKLEEELDGVKMSKRSVEVNLDNLKNENLQLTEKVTSLEQQTRDLAQARDAAPSAPRTIEEAKKMIARLTCPVCGGKMKAWKGQYGDRLSCYSCSYKIAGTPDNPDLTPAAKF